MAVDGSKYTRCQKWCWMVSSVWVINLQFIWKGDYIKNNDLKVRQVSSAEESLTCLQTAMPPANRSSKASMLNGGITVASKNKLHASPYAKCEKGAVSNKQNKSTWDLRFNPSRSLLVRNLQLPHSASNPQASYRATLALLMSHIGPQCPTSSPSNPCLFQPPSTTTSFKTVLSHQKWSSLVSSGLARSHTSIHSQNQSPSFPVPFQDLLIILHLHTLPSSPPYMKLMPFYDHLGWLGMATNRQGWIVS